MKLHTQEIEILKSALFKDTREAISSDIRNNFQRAIEGRNVEPWYFEDIKQAFPQADLTDAQADVLQTLTYAIDVKQSGVGEEEALAILKDVIREMSAQEVIPDVYSLLQYAKEYNASRVK